MTTNEKNGAEVAGARKGGRKRTGNLVWRASGWRARIRIDEDGRSVRKFIDLETTNKSVARRKLNRLVGKAEAGDLQVDDAEKEATRYSTDDFAKEHYDARSKWVKSWKDEKRIYDDCLKPKIGTTPIGEVTAADIQECLNDAAAVRAHESVKKVRSQAFAIFKAARFAGLIQQNPVELVETPDPRRKKLPRAIPTDDEFARYVMFPHAVGHKRPPNTVDLEIKVMAIVARTVGGQRGSDVHALEWPAVDIENFAKMRVRRPKTEHLSDELDDDEYVVPEVARPFLKAWWMVNGQRTDGPVFPNRRGKRAGEAKGKVSHAHALRRDMRRAFGLDAWDAKERQYVETRSLTSRERELFVGTDRIRPVDFHSMRRAFATGLRRAKVDARDAMRLSAHTSFETHQRYVLDDGPIAAPPAAALPTLAAVLPIQRLGSGRAQSRKRSGKTLTISSGWQDLNLQQPAPKEPGASESSVSSAVVVLGVASGENENSAGSAWIGHGSVPDGGWPALLSWGGDEWA
jgi:integrase